MSGSRAGRLALPSAEAFGSTLLLLGGLSLLLHSDTAMAGSLPDVGGQPHHTANVVFGALLGVCAQKRASGLLYLQSRLCNSCRTGQWVLIWRRIRHYLIAHVCNGHRRFGERGRFLGQCCRVWTILCYGHVRCELGIAFCPHGMPI